MIGSVYLNKWHKVPVAVKQFIVRALIILVIWKIVYLVFLLPARVLDGPLSSSVARGSATVLNYCTHSRDYTSRNEPGDVQTDNGVVVMLLVNIYFHQNNIVSIEDGCNGLELFVLYAGFIISMPATLKRKIWFIAGGILLIYIVNVLRCAGITYIILYSPKNADFAHHYVFTFIVYGLIIALWLIFSKKLNLVHAETE